MVNVSKLKGKIVEQNTTFYRKMKQNGNFSIKEVNLIVSALNLSKDEAMAIFFSEIVA